MRKLSLVLLLFVATVLPARAQVAVVVNKSVPAAQVDAGDVLDIYALEKAKWGDGTRVVVFTQDAQADVFFSQLGRSQTDLKKVWLRKKLSGEGQPPEVLKSDEEVLARVAATPGAVGFVSAGKVNGQVKVVATFN